MVEPVRAKSKTRAHASKKRANENSIVEFVKVVLQALVIAVVVRTFLFQPFNIPSGSLIPTLLVGDYLFVSKYAYGYSKYSLPFSPNLFSGRILSSVPKRGDIVVFRWPVDNSTDFIKRVIGVPGDEIRTRNGDLYINGQKVQREFLGEYDEDEGAGRKHHVRRYMETLPGGVSHLMQTFDDSDHFLDNADKNNPFKVQPGTVFMMGDNRDNSADSRQWGPVPLENLIGRAEIIFFSMKTIPGETTSDGEPATEPAWQFWRWPWTVRWNRIFQRVH